MNSFHRITVLHPDPRPRDLDLADIGAAISLVAAGVATRVQLVNLRCLDDVAFDAAALAQRAGVRASVDRAGGVAALIIEAT